MSTRLADRLSAARRRRFVGRDTEKALFESALGAEQPQFSISFICGPGGVGKTSLLHEFVSLAAQQGIDAIYLDGRNIDPTPDAFLSSLIVALGGLPPANAFELMSSRGQQIILLVDTYETLGALDSWLRNNFLPEMPANSLVVLAGRMPPSVGWRTDPGWQSLLHTTQLRNLTPDETSTYLDLRTVPRAEHEQIVNFTHGHPLAISLVADLLDQQPDQPLDLGQSPDVVRVLLQRLIQDAPTRHHRLALEACAMTRYMTEGLLAEMLEVEDAHDYFSWLRGLSFVGVGRLGLFLHDLVREATAADLRWRNPDLYRELHQRARKYYHRRLHETQGQMQRRVLSDLVYLHRDNSVVRPFYEWQDNESVYIDRAHPQDVPTLLAMVRKHEGEAAAALAAFWLERQLQNAVVIRNMQQQALGYVLFLALHHANADEIAHDPATRAAWSYLQHSAPLRANEIATYFRFWMDADQYQGISAVQSRVFLACVQHYLTTPALAYSLFPCADPQFYAGIFAYADLQRIPEADFSVEGRRYGVYGHDWRISSPAAWLDLLAEREVAASAGQVVATEPPPPTQPVMVLSEPEFATAVREALRHFTQPNELQHSPLVRSRLVIDRSNGENGSGARSNALQTLLKETTEQLQASPKQNKLYRAVYHTYLKPAATQELAAELLDLPFSTYRRHLKEGIDVIVETLWNRELGNVL